MDGFLRAVSGSLGPSEIACALADDLAAVIWRELSLRALQDLFEEFGGIAGLFFWKKNKCVLAPRWTRCLEKAREHFCTQAPLNERLQGRSGGPLSGVLVRARGWQDAMDEAVRENVEEDWGCAGS